MASVSGSGRSRVSAPEIEDPIVARLLLERDTWKPFGNMKVCCCDLIMFGPIRSWWWILEIYTFAVTVVFFYEYEKYDSVAYPIVGGIGYFIILVTSFKAIFCNPGIVKRPTFEKALSNAREVERMTKAGVPYPTRRVDMQTYSYCMDCHHFRPPLTGHCHVCDVCVERMDHHCPIVGLCVGKNNLLSFQIMAIAMSLYHTFLLMSGVVLLINRGRNDGFKGGDWWEASITLDITVVGFLLAMMLPAILSNMKCEDDPPLRRPINRWNHTNRVPATTTHSNSQEPEQNRPADVENGNPSSTENRN